MDPVAISCDLSLERLMLLQLSLQILSILERRVVGHRQLLVHPFHNLRKGN